MNPEIAKLKSELEQVRKEIAYMQRLEGLELIIIKTISKVNKEPEELFKIIAENIAQAIRDNYQPKEDNRNRKGGRNGHK